MDRRIVALGFVFFLVGTFLISLNSYPLWVDCWDKVGCRHYGRSVSWEYARFDLVAWIGIFFNFVASMVFSHAFLTPKGGPALKALFAVLLFFVLMLCSLTTIMEPGQ